MNISLGVLKKYGACNSGIECFKYLNTTTVHDTINKCMDLSDNVVLRWTVDKLDKYKWCNWLLSRILSKENKIKYAIYSARAADNAAADAAADAAYAVAYAVAYAADRKEMFRSIINYGLTLITEQDNTK